MHQTKVVSLMSLSSVNNNKKFHKLCSFAYKNFMLAFQNNNKFFHSMAINPKACAVFLVMILLLGLMSSTVCYGAVYKVGDSAGWTTMGNVDYKQWAATKTFKIGDLIVFSYNAEFHNVLQVKHAMYRTCNVSSPLATYTSGNDTITIKTYGHHFFFCGVPGHCQAGQKVDINVLSAPHIAPTPSSIVPSSPSVESPAPNSKSAPLSLNPLMGLAMPAVFLIMALAS